MERPVDALPQALRKDTRHEAEGRVTPSPLRSPQHDARSRISFLGRFVSFAMPRFRPFLRVILGRFRASP